MTKALWFSVLAYIISFVIGNLIAAAFGVRIETGETIPASLWLVNMAITLVVVVIFSLWYFLKDKKITVNVREGFYFGLVILVVGVILDLVISLAIIVNGSPQNLAAYYASPFYYITIVLVVVTPVIVARILEKLPETKHVSHASAPVKRTSVKKKISRRK